MRSSVPPSLCHCNTLLPLGEIASPCWPALLLLWDLTRSESRWFGCRQNNSSFYGNSFASPPTTAFRSLLSNRGGFSSSLEPSQQQSHPRRNHLAFCKEPLLPGVLLQGGWAVREVEGECMKEVSFQSSLPMAAKVTGVRTEVWIWDLLSGTRKGFSKPPDHLSTIFCCGL